MYVSYVAEPPLKRMSLGRYKTALDNVLRTFGHRLSDLRAGVIDQPLVSGSGTMCWPVTTRLW